MTYSSNYKQLFINQSQRKILLNYMPQSKMKKKKKTRKDPALNGCKNDAVGLGENSGRIEYPINETQHFKTKRFKLRIL